MVDHRSLRLVGLLLSTMDLTSSKTSTEDDEQVTVLAIGDPHFKEDNKRTTDELVQKVLELVRERRPDYVVIMGDTLHRFKTLNQYANHDAIQWFRALGSLSRLFVLIGNHDRPTADDFLSDYHAFIALEDRTDMTIVSRPVVHYEPKLNGHLLFVPFVPPKRFGDALSYFDKNELETGRMLFCHQEFTECDYRGFKSTGGDDWPSYDFPIIAGHIHKYQRLGEKIVYVGTPFQENFGETEAKTISWFTVTSRSWKEERIFLHCRPKKELIIEAERLSSFVHDDSADWKVVLKGTSDSLTVAETSRLFAELQMKGVIFDRIATDDLIALDSHEEDGGNESVSLIEALRKEIDGKAALQRILQEVLTEIDHQG